MTAETRTAAIIVSSVCMAQILSMLAFAAYPTLIPVLQAQWGSSSTEIGWVAGIYFGGYLAAVGILVSNTDLVDARKIYLWSMALGILSPLGFAYLTSGVVSASLWRCLQGIALAGTYMPGLKALVDAVPDRLQSRTVAVYTACFGVGVGVSFLAAGLMSAHFSWPGVFACSAIGPAIGLCLAFFTLPSAPAPAGASQCFRWLPDFKPALRNRAALGFSIAYSAHNMELFVFRSWIVAYLVFSFSLRESGTFGSHWNPATIAAVISLASQPFSVVTNEIAERLGRIRVILCVMAASAATGIALGFSGSADVTVVLLLAALYGILCMSDSAAITAAVVKSADPARRGATLALHSLVGFAGAFFGPIAFGAALDYFGKSNPHAWGLAFVVIAAFAVAGPAAILRLSRNRA